MNLFVTLLAPMKKFKIVLVVIVAVLILGSVGLFLIGVFNPKGAGLSIESSPSATVFISGVQVGKTPYEVTRKPGEIVVKLVPDSVNKPLSPYETKVTLIPGIRTIIKRQFGETDVLSSGEIISFDKVGGTEASLAVVSMPDSAQVSVDGAIRGFAPVLVSAITPGEHQIIVAAPGYTDRTLSLDAKAGYKLTAIVKLAPNGQSGANQAPKTESQTLVEILSTPTGFLRVRTEASAASAELAQVKPGEKYPFIDEDTDAGWYKIEYEKGKKGWVIKQYAKKIEEAAPSPTATPSGKVGV